MFNEEFLPIANEASNLNIYELFFIYYSGHGVMNGTDTLGIAIDDSRINLDQYVAQLSARANTFVLAFFDCCRTHENHKGIPIPLEHNI